MKLDLTNQKESEIKYTLSRFPDGEIHFSLCDPILDLKGTIDVKCRITSAEELFIVLQVGDILDRFGFAWNLWISYLMSMRMDRVMSCERPYSLQIVCNMLKSMNYKKIGVLEAHSNKTYLLLGNRYISCPFFYTMAKSIADPSDCCLVYPDNGALERYASRGSMFGTIVFDKKRDLETGKFLSFDIEKIDNRFDANTFVFVDDLCDAGGTFLAELAILKEKFPNGRFGIMVCHAVNPVGIERLCENFDFVVISNSYKDWEETDKLTVLDAWNS